MKCKTLTVGLSVVLSMLLATISFASGEPPKPEKLVVSWWGFNLDLLNKNIAVPFEQKYGIKIEWDVGDNAPRLNKLIAYKDKPVVDVAAFSSLFAFRAIKEGVLQRYTPENIPNLQNIYEWARDPLGGGYVIAYTVQCMGIYYRSDKITPPVTSWKDFWRPELKGRITWPELSTTYGPALLLMTAKIWGGSEYDLNAGWGKIEDLLKNVLTIYRRSSEVIMLLQQGEVWLAPLPSFAWGTADALGLPLVRVLPEEGVIGEMSMVGVVKGTPNAYWAEKFIDFLLSYEVQLAEALDLVDSPVNLSAVADLPSDIAQKLVVDEALIRNLVFFDTAFIAEHLDEWLTKWEEVKSKME